MLGAEAAAEALDLAEQLRPALVLAGELDLCRRLREGEPGRSWDRDVPVILIGGVEEDVVDRVRALERGADDYLGRPFNYEELLARIRAVLRRSAPPRPDVIEAGEIEIDRPTRCVRIGGASPAAREGVRAAGQAGRAADAGVHEGGAAARGVGLPGDGPDADTGLACVASPAQARGADRHAVRAQRVGRGVPADVAGVARPVGAAVGDMTMILVTMETLPLATVKARLSELVDRVEREDDRIVVTRNGRPAAVLVSPDDLESLEETLAVLSDPALVKKVRAGDRAAARGDVVPLDELKRRHPRGA